MNVSLTPQLEKYVAGKVKAGMYQTASEVVREALRALQAREDSERRRRELVAELDRGLDELDRGEGEQVRATDVLARIRSQTGKSKRK
jgi:antitoxin ParD1/3/4